MASPSGYGPGKTPGSPAALDGVKKASSGYSLGKMPGAPAAVDEEQCVNGCGRPRFQKFPTCCTHCKGGEGPHARNCETKANRPRLHVVILSASGLENQDWFSHQDPYCKLHLGEKVAVTKTVNEGGTCPKWEGSAGVVDLDWEGEEKMNIVLWDEDVGKEDDYIGECYVNLRALEPTGEFKGNLRVFRTGITTHGTLSLEITCRNFTKRSEAEALPVFEMIPCKVHCNSITGTIQSSESSETRRDFKCFEVGLQQVAETFGESWNAGADGIHPDTFASNPIACAIRVALSTAHNVLYMDEFLPGQGPLGMRTSRHWMARGQEFLDMLDNGSYEGRRRVYTYSLLDEGLFFSETGATLAKDNASKHAIHANAAMKVRFAGTFRICCNASGKSVLVFDNDSGTYMPKKDHLPLLKRLFEINLPGVPIYALHVVDPQPQETLDFVGPKEKKGDPNSVYAGTWVWRSEAKDQNAKGGDS